MKKALLLVVCMALVAAIAVSATVAYFTDREEVVNVMTAGNVQIQLNEQQRDGNGGLEAFEQNKVLMPIVGSAQGTKDSYGMPIAKNFVDKIVSVTNTGKSDAFVRVLVAVPAALEGATANDNALHWNLANKYAPNGDGIVPEILNTRIYDDICIINDDEAIQTAKDLASKEGIMCGISSGTNVAAAIKLAKKLGKGKTVVTVLPDTAERYFSTPLFE